MNTNMDFSAEATIEEMNNNYYIKENKKVKDLKMKKETKLIVKLMYRIVKRIIDFIGGIIGTIILIPLTIGIFIANIMLKNKGPIFYVQERIGKNGKIFKMYKFRSMVVGADEKLDKYLAENLEAFEEYKVYKKLKDDPRVTKVGDFIRKTSLDEFPQFINVLKGQMSLVGPRPYLPREIEDMGDYYSYIIKNKPGVTGYWQVRGRNDVTFSDRLKMDMDYHNKANLLLDMKLIIKTILRVVKKEGAI